jgi:Icc-related predicted phosphoesterase
MPYAVCVISDPPHSPESEYVRVAALSDLHGNLFPPAHMPACDLIVIAGDVCPLRFDDQLWPQQQWLKSKFTRWLQRLPVPVVGIAGNHDRVFANTEEPLPPELPWHYLQDQKIELCGLSIYGTPWIPWMGSELNAGRGWAFQGPEDDGDEQMLQQQFKGIPAGLDVLLSHAPPYCYRDLTMEGELTGSRALRDVIDRVNPRLLVCGHIHEGRGNQWRRQTLVANVASLDWDYRPQKPVVTLFDIPLDRELPVIVLS